MSPTVQALRERHRSMFRAPDLYPLTLHARYRSASRGMVDLVVIQGRIHGWTIEDEVAAYATGYPNRVPSTPDEVNHRSIRESHHRGDFSFQLRGTTIQRGPTDLVGDIQLNMYLLNDLIYQEFPEP